MKKIFFGIAVLTIFTSCVTVKKINNLEPVFVTNSKQINLLPPEKVSEPLDTVMLMTVQFGEEKISAPVYIIADDTGIFITILNDFGIDMGVLEYNGDFVFLDCAIVPEKLKGEYLINEFQNAFYNFDALKENLAESRMRLVLEENDDGTYFRKLFDGKKIIEEISFLADGKIEIDNILRNYQITFTPSL